MADAPHQPGLPSDRAEAEPAVRQPGGLIPGHHSVGAGGHKLDLHLQLEAGDSVRGGAGLSVGSRPENCWSDTELNLSV